MYKKYKNYYGNQKLISNPYTETLKRCENALNSAMNKDMVVSILGSGDTGIYGIANIILEKAINQTDKVTIEVIPGMPFAITGAALLGAPITQDFAVMTLSDNIANAKMLSEKIIALAKTDFAIVFYSICNPTFNNLVVARDILLKYRAPTTPVGLTMNLGTNEESIIISTLEKLPFKTVNAYSTLFVGNGKTRILKSQKMVTPLE